MNKQLLLIIALLLALPSMAAKKAQKPTLIVTDLRTERMVNPMSIDTPTPRLGWRLESTEQNVVQTAYHVIVASSREKAEALEGDLWDVTVESDQSQWVRYEGKPLKSNTRCYWRVQVKPSRPTPQPLPTGRGVDSSSAGFSVYKTNYASPSEGGDGGGSAGFSPWSDIAMWNVGLLTESDWRGRWIGLDRAMPWDREEEHSRLSARYLRTEFQVDKPVRQATLYISGLGLYECFINGQRVGDQVLAPMPTDYRRTVLYNAYDVTSLLRVESLGLSDYSFAAEEVKSLNSPLSTLNSIAVVLGNGRYYTMQQKKKPYKITNFGYPTLRANLIIEFEDGSRKVVATDEKWRLNPDGPIRSNNEYDGEVYDARKAFSAHGKAADPTKAEPDWTLPGFDDSGWMKAERTAIPYGTLRGQMSPGMKVVQTLKPKSVTRKGDKLIIDMGQNIAGWLKVRLSPLTSQRDNIAGHTSRRDNALAYGDSIAIRYAEKLDSAGNLWTENLRHAESTDRYYACGNETADTWWHPVFSYHGFRYAEITGLIKSDSLQHRDALTTKSQRREAWPTTDDFIAEVISDDMDETGTFVSGDTILNKVYQNARWGILSNYKGMPVDCPQRDERQPWLGDRTRGCFGEAFLFDNQTLYAKWARDICEAQREDGCIPDVAPAFWNYYSDDLTWAAALPMTLKMLRDHYGDEVPLQKFYANVKRWLEHLKDCYQKDGIIYCGKYGDWCVPPEREDLIHSEDPARKTDVSLISTAYYYYICKSLSPNPIPEQSSPTRSLSRGGGASWFAEEAALTKEAFNRTFLTVKKGTAKVPGHWLYPDSTYYGNNTVTANLLPCVFGMIDDDYVKQQVEKQIVKKLLDQNDGTVTCGVIGIGWLMHALTQMGRTDLAWLLATNKNYPSWGYMAEHGATTIWELWNGDTASPKMNSGNHVMLLGDLLSWLYEDIAGIKAAEPGFKHIAMAPDFCVDEIDHIDASYNSIYGKIVSRWRKEHGQLFWHVEIPANTKATLRLPDGEKKTLGSGSYDLTLPLKYNVTFTPPSRLSHSPSTPQVITDEFLYKDAPFPSCHSATIVETKKGDLVATFFGGTKERNPDVCIWVCRKPKGAKDWTAPVMVADGVDMTPGLKVNTNNKTSQVTTMTKPAFGAQFMPVNWIGNWGAAVVGDASQRHSSEPIVGDASQRHTPYYREACWNPVLFETPDGLLHLYFKIGPNVAGWKGWRITSKDGGKTWSRREPLPDGIYGPIKNKPYSLTPDRLISPTSDERNGWKCYFELSDDNGKTWRRTAFVEADSGVLAIQPTIIQLPESLRVGEHSSGTGRLEALCRTRSRHIGVTFSDDNGETWSRLQLIDTPNNNSGIDAVTLSDGCFALICNDWPIEPDKQKGARTPLSILRSDDGLHWEHWVTLEDSPISQYSYPSIIQTRDGHLHAIYTWRRQRIKHVELIP